MAVVSSDRLHRQCGHAAKSALMSGSASAIKTAKTTIVHETAAREDDQRPVLSKVCRATRVPRDSDRFEVIGRQDRDGLAMALQRCRTPMSSAWRELLDFDREDQRTRTFYLELSDVRERVFVIEADSVSGRSWKGQPTN